MDYQRNHFDASSRQLNKPFDTCIRKASGSPPRRERVDVFRRTDRFCAASTRRRRILNARCRSDFQEALAALLDRMRRTCLGVVTRLTAEWQADYDGWQKRDLSARHYVYVWADGVYLQARMEDNAECMLVLIGATPEGKKELVGFQTGVRESAQSWRELLIDIKRRGLEIAPDLAVGDGALGFWKAIEEVFPGTKHQRCWVHKTVNVLNKVALSVQVNMKADLREIYGAPTRAIAEAAIDVFAEKYGAKYEKASPA